MQKKNNAGHSSLISILILCFQLNLYAQSNDSVPNVILIVVDDMGWNDVSYHGSEIQTPTIDKLARQGVELNRFYVHPTCTPTRGSLLTGKTAVRLGIADPIGKNNVKGLPLSEKILPQYFKEKGYSTSLIGKWHLGRFKKEYWPNYRGFDHFYGYLSGGVGHYDHVNGGSLDWQRNGATIEEDGYSTHLLTDEAIKVIEAKKERPLFMELCYAAPHLPNEAPEEAVTAYQHLESKNRQVHAAMVSEIDRGIQRIVQTLEEVNLLENTIIWFLSDNGGLNLEATPKEMAEPIIKMTQFWGEPLPLPFLEFVRENIVNGAGDNSPLKGGKSSCYEGGLRVPSFIYAPKYLQGQKVDHRITVNDVLPTLATVANFKHLDTSQLDGVSQWTLLTNESGPRANTFISVATANQAYFKEEWKLLLPNEGKAELYKIEKDPSENNDLSDEYPEIVEILKAELLEFPRGAPIVDPFWHVFKDPDFFGGEVRREALAGVEGRVSGPLHRSFYIVGIICLIIMGSLIWIFKKILWFILKKLHPSKILDSDN